MGIFTRYINVEDYLNRIDRLLKVNLNQKEIKEYLKQVRDYIVYIMKNHGHTLHPNEIAKLDKVLGMINDAEKSNLTLSGFGNIKDELSSIFNLTRVYLLRHPEKPKKGETSRWEALQAIQKLEMSRAGVKQARAFARFLAEEVILCPKPVNVILYCSEVPRTWLFAEIIRRQLIRTAAYFGKHIDIAASQITQHPALYFRFSKECLIEMDEDYKKSEFAAFASWLQGKYKSCPNPSATVSEVEAWVREGLKNPSVNSWTIVIGVSHSFIIDSLLYYKTKEHKSIIPTADYAKFIGSSLYYQGKWYVN